MDDRHGNARPGLTDAEFATRPNIVLALGRPRCYLGGYLQNKPGET
ncbi:MAG: hypothetical protein QOI87_1011 [Bradyrhizobium sp.]|jgi:hypothetical protein|nr:hypothetical protein [Bradyrhizobium sp.]